MKIAMPAMLAIIFVAVLGSEVRAQYEPIEIPTDTSADAVSLPSFDRDPRPTGRGNVARPDRASGGDDLSHIQLGAVRSPLAVELPPQQSDDTIARHAPGRNVGMGVAWVPPNQRHLPVYFEDVAVERYGQTISPPLQPILSGMKFVGQATLLPYQMGVESPRRLKYDVGFARPGSPTPPVREHLPLSARGILYQGTAATGVYFFVHP